MEPLLVIFYPALQLRLTNLQKLAVIPYLHPLNACDKLIFMRLFVYIESSSIRLLNDG